MENAKHLTIIFLGATAKAPRLYVVCFHLLKLIMSFLTTSSNTHRADAPLFFILFPGHIGVKSAKMQIPLFDVLRFFG